MKSNGMGSGMWFCISYFAIQFNTQLEARTMRETLRHRDAASMRHNVPLFSFLRGLSQTADRGANCHPSYDSKISASFNPTGESSVPLRMVCPPQRGERDTLEGSLPSWITPGFPSGLLSHLVRKQQAVSQRGNFPTNRQARSCQLRSFCFPLG